MKKTFREKVIFMFGRIIKKYAWLKGPCFIAMTLILGVHKMLLCFVANGKKLAGAALAVIFFLNSCSFSYAVFGAKAGFINAEDTYSAVIEDSNIELAKQVELDESAQLLIEDSDLDMDVEYIAKEELEDIDSYTLDDILGSHENYSDFKTTDAKETGLKEFHFDSSDWRLVLVNKQHPIPDDYTFTLGTIKGSMQCDERIIEDLLSMLKAAKEDGVNLAICSPYRDLNRQQVLFNKKIKIYMEQGMSYMEAYKVASQAVTVPGASEHQMGLALDIFSDTYTALDEGFGDTKAGKWLAENSYYYGFTLRYPKGKEYITSIEYEPWHFRYVGKEAALVMEEEGICLEEFWDRYL